MAVKCITKTCQISHRTVNNVLNTYNEAGTMEIKSVGKCGRKNKPKNRDDSILVNKSSENRRVTSFYLQQALANFGVHDSIC